jgi:hypothetical protein
MSAVDSHVSALDLRLYLNRLRLERVEAKEAGLGDCEVYMTELDDEIAHSTSAFVGAAVTEMATLRGELFGRQEG